MASLSILHSQSLLKLLYFEPVMLSNLLILCHHLGLLQSNFPSIWVFSNESVFCIGWPMYWSFSSSIGLSSLCSGLLSFRMDWFHLLELQVAVKSLPQTPIQKRHFFCAQLSLWPNNSHIHNMTTGKTIPMTRWTFVSKLMSLLIHMLSR